MPDQAQKSAEKEEPSLQLPPSAGADGADGAAASAALPALRANGFSLWLCATRPIGQTRMRADLRTLRGDGWRVTL